VLSFTASGHPYTSSKGAPSFCRSSFLPDTVSLCVDDESSSVSHRSPEVLFPYFRVWPFSPTVSPHVRDHRAPRDQIARAGAPARGAQTSCDTPCTASRSN
jgi:hypothetical protein